MTNSSKREPPKPHGSWRTSAHNAPGSIPLRRDRGRGQSAPDSITYPGGTALDGRPAAAGRYSAEVPMSRFTTPLLVLSLMSPLHAAEPRVEIIAHRGASHDAPENTLAAIRLAWQQQADGSEFDIHLTRDGKIAVLHDKDTKRTAGVKLVAADTPLAELRALDVGAWKGPRFVGEKVPTLAEMLATVPAGKKVFVEVKCGPEIVPELDRVLKASRLEPKQTPVISFNFGVVAAVKKARPDVP